MVINPNVTTADASGIAISRSSAGNADIVSGIVSALKDTFGDINAQAGDIVIPVYLGNTMLDEIIVNAQQRTNLRSGGR